VSRRAYADTSVPIERTKEAIRSLLRKYEGVRGFQFREDWGTDTIGFEFGRLEKGKDADGKAVEVPVVVKMMIHVAHEGRKKSQYSGKDWEQRERQVWRALYHYLKSQLEAVEFGLRSFTDAFMADIVMREGRTIGDYVRGALLTGRLALPESVERTSDKDIVR
jgi:hypothetical protein